MIQMHQLGFAKEKYVCNTKCERHDCRSPIRYQFDLHLTKNRINFEELKTGGDI